MMKKRTPKMRWITPISLIPISFLFIPIIVHGLKEETSSTMSLELVHRHDPRLAGYGKESPDRFERIKELAHRDMIRHQRRKAWETFEMPMHAGRDYGSGEYFVQVRVGTPSQRFWLLADTGSDLTWFNCNDDPRDFTTPSIPRPGSSSLKSKPKRLFSPRRSSSFQRVTCSSPKCKVELRDLFSLQACLNPSDPCQYDFRYLDGSAARGFFGNDVITVGLSNGRKGKLNNMVIGCTRSVIDGPTLNKNTDGLLGLGLSKESFVAKAASQYGGKFSYCLVDHLSHKNVSNFLTFGTTITPKANLLTEIHRTPLVIISPNYGLNVVGLSINGQMLRIPRMVWDFKANGGTILDSGTSLTFLTTPAYEPVIEVLVRGLERLEKVKATEPFAHCYRAKGFDESFVPRLAFHFDGGARFDPPVKSYVIDVGLDVKCIGIVRAVWPGASTIGNIMQQNHLWEFDLARNIVGFAPSSCHH